MAGSAESNVQLAHTTAHHAKYFAWELTRRRAASEEDRLAQSLFDASVDLNPHQIDAALFALNNPLSKGVVLADEVGLGKTIEAALVLCQLWAERRRRLLVICPAALRKQWVQELADKFNLPAEVLDARTWHRLRESGIYDPLDRDVISVMSIHFAARMETQLAAVPWDVVVIDEAHKLRNAHRKSHETGQALKRALAGRKKLLLTATPLQNSLMELYGLTSLIDEEIFGDERSFRSQYGSIDGDIQSLRRRLQPFIKRTLRRDVQAPTGAYQLIRKGETPPEHARVYRLTHPLGQYVLDTGRNLQAPLQSLTFQYGSHKPRISMVERLVGQAGWMQLNLLELDSFQHEEHLVFTAMTDTGEVLDQESCEKLFYLLATTTDLQTSPPMELQANAQRQLEATLSRALELNDQFFQQERDKLEAWAEDRIASAEQALKDTKLKLKGLKRQARMALSMEDAQRLQQDIRKTETEQRRQRQEIFAVEDEIEARRDALIAALQKRLHRASRNQSLFVLRWSVV